MDADQTGLDAGRGAWWAAILLALLIAAAFVWLAGRSTLWDRDEPRFAQASVEMLAAGDYLVPTFNGRLRADKPVLIYWLMSAAFRVLGPSETAARLPSCLATAIASWLTFRLGRKLISARAGLWAMVMLASAPLVLLEGQAATTDAVLLAAITAAALSFTTGAEGGGAWSWLGLGLSLGVALLAKGPVGLLLPALAMGTYGWLRGRPAAASGPARAAGAAGTAGAAGAAGAAAVTARGAPAAFDRRRLAVRAGLAVVLGVAIFCAWGIPANRATGGELARLGLGTHFVGRALGPMEGHGGAGRWAGPLFYLAVIWIGFAPWVAFLPAAIGRRRGTPQARAFLVAWGLPPLVVMSLSATQLPHYVLPAWPALALAAAACLAGVTQPAEPAAGATERAAGAGRAGAPRAERLLRRGAWLLAVPVAASWAAAAWLGWHLLLPRDPTDPTDLSGLSGLSDTRVAAVLRSALLLAALLAVAGTGVLILQLRSRWRAGAFLALAGQAAALAVAGLSLAPAAERLKVAPALAAAIRSGAAPSVAVRSDPPRAATAPAPSGASEPLATWGYGEPSLVFYLRRWPVPELAGEAEAAAWLARPGPHRLVLRRDLIGSLAARRQSPPWQEIAAARGWNIAKGQWVDLIVIRSGG